MWTYLLLSEQAGSSLLTIGYSGPRIHGAKTLKGQRCIENMGLDITLCQVLFLICQVQLSLDIMNFCVMKFSI